MRVRLQEWGAGFDRLADRIRDMMQEMRSPQNYCSHGRPSWIPRINLYETSDHVIVCAELPGLIADKIDLRLVDNVLRIEGNRQRLVFPEEYRDTISVEEVSVHIMEIDSGNFCREIRIPANVEPERAVASYRHGLLWVIAPKTPQRIREQT